MKSALMVLGCFATAFVMTTCTGGGSGVGKGSGSANFSANVEVKAKVDIPKAQLKEMPEKYQVWAKNANDFLELVAWAENQVAEAQTNLAVSFGLSNDASPEEIAKKVRDSIKVKVEMKVVADVDLEAKAEGKASGEASNGNASGGILAAAQAKASAEVKVEMVETKEVAPIVKDNWDKIQLAIATMKKVPSVVADIRSQSQVLNKRGNQLVADVPKDLAEHPTLAPKIPQIKSQLDKGAKACGEADARIDTMQSATVTINGALDEKFPDVG